MSHKSLDNVTLNYFTHPQLHTYYSRQNGLLGTFSFQLLSGRAHSLKAMLLTHQVYYSKTAHYSGISQISLPGNKEICFMLQALGLYFKTKQICKIKQHCQMNRKKVKRKSYEILKYSSVSFQNFKGTSVSSSFRK